MAAMCLYCGNLTEKNKMRTYQYLPGWWQAKQTSSLSEYHWRRACASIINQILLSPQIQDISWTAVLELFRLRVDSKLILDMLCFVFCFKTDTKHIFVFCFKTDTKNMWAAAPDTASPDMNGHALRTPKGNPHTHTHTHTNTRAHSHA